MIYKLLEKNDMELMREILEDDNTIFDILQFAKSHLAEITTPLHLMFGYLSDRTPVIIVPCVKEYIFSVSQNSFD